MKGKGIPLIDIERKLLMRYGILMRQLGNVGGDIVFYLRGIDGYLDKFDITRMKINLADAMFQVNLLCKDLGLNPDDVFKMGEDRYLERKQEFICKGKGDLFI